MTGENPLVETLAAVKADLAEVSWHTRLQTMLMTVGLLAFGFMLGVHFYAAHTFGVLPPLAFNPEYQPLQSLYNTTMKYGTVVALAGLLGGFGLELTGRDTDD
jgi:hypothetical protein